MTKIMSIEDETTLENSADPSETLIMNPEALEGEPPIQQLNRFRLERLLGQGGMGQVWEAWDPQLERRVAIKRLRSTQPSARRRFVREARLQATIAHPRICPVFEVGFASGEPFLVMPCLDGVPLDQAVEGSSLEYKLELMRQVAEAVHAAHQQGLIHRDLKPANILVESPTDGPSRPVVLDFGIARPMEGEGLTASGEIIGTPAYMAPEQVEGGHLMLDRRTDVYALGATLYRLLTGQPPHNGEGTPLLLSIANEEPERLPSGEIPTEVEAIVFKCLEKEKNKRYSSALALSEDLGRYLAGETVLASPVTRWIRLRKWMRRNRTIVRVTAATSLMVLAVLALGGWSVLRSKERQDAARRFGVQVEEIEAQARNSHLPPVDGNRADQNQLRTRLDAIREELDERDPVIRALAYHALGRGHLALSELESAREFLESAYELDPDNAEIAADLGVTLSELYRDRLASLQQTQDSKGRESAQLFPTRLPGIFQVNEQRKQWQQTLENPARDLLTSGLAPRSVELDSLIRFHEGEPQAALDLLVSERLRLEGDIRRSWGASLAATGDSDEEARQRLQEARQSYNQALAIAPGHSALLLGDAKTVVLLVRLGLAAIDEVHPLIEEARENLRKAREFYPERLECWLWTVHLELEASSHAFQMAQDPSPWLAGALEAAQQALKIDSQASEVWLNLAQTHRELGRWQRFQGEDPMTNFELAAQAFDRVAPEDRDYLYHLQVAILRTVRATHRAESGLEPTDAYQAAIESYRSAAKIHSAPFAALVNLGAALFEAASLESISPRDLLNWAVEVFEEAHQRRPENMVPFYYLGLCRILLAQDGRLAQTMMDDAMAELAQADFERAIELAPERFQPWVVLGELFQLRAVASYIRGQDPAPFFDRARQSHDRALKLAPDQPIALLNLAWTAYFDGKFALRGGQDPTAQFEEAEELCRRSLENNRRPKALLCLGSVWRMQAEHHLNREEFERVVSRISAAEDMFKEILSIDPEHPEAHRSLGRLMTLEAQKLRRLGEDPSSSFNRARSYLNKALELENSVADFHLADAYWHLERAEWQRDIGRDFSESVTAGRSSLDSALHQQEGHISAIHLQKDFDTFID